jgi:hypothetical protein
MKICEKCKSELNQATSFEVNGVWHCDKCAGSCDYCGVSALLDYLLSKNDCHMCADCQYILDDYEMESFKELLC